MTNIFDKTITAIDKNEDRPQVPARGTSFIDGFNDLVTEIDPGDTVSLVPDPDNKYDRNAVRIIHDDTKKFIGHLPKEHCPDFHQEIKQGYHWKAIIDVIFDAEDDKGAGLRLVLDPVDGPVDKPVESSVTTPNSDIAGAVLKHLDVTATEAQSIADDFVDTVTIIAEENGFVDDRIVDRTLNAANLLLSGGADIGLINDEELDNIASEYTDLASEDPMTWDIEEIFEGIIPDYVAIGVAEEDGRIFLSVTFDRENLPVALWERGVPSSSLFGSIIEYIVLRIGEPMGVSGVDFF